MSEKNIERLLFTSRMFFHSLSIYHYSDTSLMAAITYPYWKDLSIEIIEPAWTVETIERSFLSIQIRSYELSIGSLDFNQLLTIFNRHSPNLERFECDLSFPQ